MIHQVIRNRGAVFTIEIRIFSQNLFRFKEGMNVIRKCYIFMRNTELCVLRKYKQQLRRIIFIYNLRHRNEILPFKNS